MRSCMLAKLRHGQQMSAFLVSSAAQRALQSFDVEKRRIGGPGFGLGALFSFLLSCMLCEVVWSCLLQVLVMRYLKMPSRYSSFSLESGNYIPEMKFVLGFRSYGETALRPRHILVQKK